MYFPYQVFSKVFLHIYCHLSRLLNILGGFISQENHLVMAGNRNRERYLLFQIAIYGKATDPAQGNSEPCQKS